MIASVLFGYLCEHCGSSTAFTTGATLAGVAAVMLLFVPTTPLSHAE